MKVLSLEEIGVLDGQLKESIDELDVSPALIERAVHTAREYHRMREALQRVFTVDLHPDDLIIVSEALKESEGE